MSCQMRMWARKVRQAEDADTSLSLFYQHYQKSAQGFIALKGCQATNDVKTKIGTMLAFLPVSSTFNQWKNDNDKR